MSARRPVPRAPVLAVPRSPEAKILGRSGFVRMVDRLQKQGLVVVFTNGCFDLLHAGHIRYLYHARSLGDVLAVGINSDKSARAIKGPERPIIPLQDRLYQLAALECVDIVCSFHEPSVLPLIRQTRPDILVKGGDYGTTGIVGWEFVSSYGGQVIPLSFSDGVSTTAIIEKIRAR